MTDDFNNDFEKVVESTTKAASKDAKKFLYRDGIDEFDISYHFKKTTTNSGKAAAKVTKEVTVPSGEDDSSTEDRSTTSATILDVPNKKEPLPPVGMSWKDMHYTQEDADRDRAKCEAEGINYGKNHHIDFYRKIYKEEYVENKGYPEITFTEQDRTSNLARSYRDVFTGESYSENSDMYICEFADGIVNNPCDDAYIARDVRRGNISDFDTAKNTKGPHGGDSPIYLYDAFYEQQNPAENVRLEGSIEDFRDILTPEQIDEIRRRNTFT